MKKLILTAVAAVAVIASTDVYAQGTVDFANSSTSYIMDAYNGGAGGVATRVGVADKIAVALYWAPLTDENNLTQIGAAYAGTLGTGIGNNPPGTGLFSAGTRTTGSATTAGSSAWFQVRAWELTYGTTYEIAVAAAEQGGRLALRGVSNKFSSGTGGAGTPPSTPVSLVGAGKMESFSVVVPEPSVIALALLGAGSLLLLRRRK